jgi:hypothetical protein
LLPSVTYDLSGRWTSLKRVPDRTLSPPQASGTDFHLIGMVAEAGSVDVASTLSLANALSSAVSSLTVGYAVRASKAGCVRNL